MFYVFRYTSEQNIKDFSPCRAYILAGKARNRKIKLKKQ